MDLEEEPHQLAAEEELQTALEHPASEEGELEEQLQPAVGEPGFPKSAALGQSDDLFSRLCLPHCPVS